MINENIYVCIYIYIYFFFLWSSLLCWLLSSCGEWASHCCGFSCCGAQDLEHRLRSCGAQA